MSILVSGSLAYDYIMDFPDSFGNHILPEKLHMLRVSFVVGNMEKNLGGTAGNIAHTIKLLGGDPHVIGTLGKDGKEYAESLKEKGINAKLVTKSKKKLTTTAHITTDKDNNQITAFYGGAGDESLDTEVAGTHKLALVTPTKKESMLKHALQCFEQNIPFIFQPAQQLTALSQQELLAMIGQATILIGNDYEMQLISEKTGWTEEELKKHVDILITTLGSEGSKIQTDENTFMIATCPPSSVEDPTGAGDAYSAGFAWGYAEGFDLETCGMIGAVAATYAIEQYGTQNHNYTVEEFEDRFEKTFDRKINNVL
jgi:adenosine kinase